MASKGNAAPTGTGRNGKELEEGDGAVTTHVPPVNDRNLEPVSDMAISSAVSSNGDTPVDFLQQTATNPTHVNGTDEENVTAKENSDLVKENGNAQENTAVEENVEVQENTMVKENGLDAQENTDAREDDVTGPDRNTEENARADREYNREIAEQSCRENGFTLEQIAMARAVLGTGNYKAEDIANIIMQMEDGQPCSSVAQADIVLGHGSDPPDGTVQIDSSPGSKDQPAPKTYNHGPNAYQVPATVTDQGHGESSHSIVVDVPIRRLECCSKPNVTLKCKFP